MTISLHGIGIGGGIAIGRAHLVSHTDLEVAHYEITDAEVAGEIARFDAAVRATRKELELLWGSIPENAPTELGAFLSLHVMLLNDHTIAREPRDIIAQQHCNAEWALKLQQDRLLEQFDVIEEEYLRERRTDVIQVVERVFKALAGQGGGQYVPPEDSRERILVANDLSPADMVLFKEAQFAAFLTDVGGPTSHTAILARSLNIPSVLALHNARQLIREGERLIVDGTAGVAIIDPSEAIVAEYRKRQASHAAERKRLQRLKSTAATTLDGTSIELLANIETPGDIEQVRSNGASGIGLYRSEFIFLGRDDLPDEEEQYEAYRQVLEGMKGQPVTIRTVDLGRDKMPKWADEDAQSAPNPALGLTGVRLCLAEPILFRTQLRALLRAGVHGKLKMLVPMLASLAEVSQVRFHVEQVKDSLREDGIPFGEDVQIGGMIEVPGAALTINHFLERLDFVSIGTNDLIQYTLAVDRGDDAVSHLYDPFHPAVLYLIAHVIRWADRMGVPVSVCGEMAGDVRLTRLLLALGLRSFSMHPAQLLNVKQVILKSDLKRLSPLASEIERAPDADRVRELLLGVT
ncbi:phosphoenolpyruvate--protein phosphotransferase [Chitinimonas sp. BJB300]|uniref:phosphoenolpyruvate--protein phosphotransferase n=1 Tax=Chitinimonas sp. BJB300 TaxID=1559339 RepID=UPI000C0E7E9C|nr:phosphoenolpyruvate--protein phosphotransferase [Chitinimonas sp. BJB300]PHV12515.1 phosphoenolpyruvate--protein phosphotransferase [Chitinimonas sp. BJB300]TSJ91135.1 phosphoenolpyruvate--protein phosphotransferase [Chitinimonas sp. BJB300]